MTRLNGEQTVVTVGRRDTDGAYAVRENIAPPDFRRVPLHIHRRAEEAFYVLAGELAVLADGQRVDAPAGAFVLIPRGTTHALANLASRPVRWLTLISPAAESEWIEAEEELLAAGGEPDPAALAAIHHRFGLELVGPPPDWTPGGAGSAAAGPR
ncbi:cupin domain-containing protein [Pseudonocardia lacus]|uniref:cupin domain-containing protein n=1 Tax=Pseudonocardia lacus TaxID=2835865 RepID=UPI001BDDC82F|nr:cupin domain-containing protein [Pseudonocardia lacus]